jgi:hypothetical protein
VFHVTTAVGTGYLGAVGVEAYWTCNLEIEDFAMGMMPVSVAATAEGATTPALTKTAAACATVVDPCNPADDPRLRADCMLPDNQMSCVTRVNCQYDTQRFDALCAYLRAIDDCSTTALDRTGETVILTGVGLCAGGLPGAIAFSRGLGLRRFPIGTAWLAPRPPSKTCGQSLNSGVRLICNGTANNDQ